MSTRQRTIGESVTLRGDLDRMEEERTMKRNDGGPAFPGEQGRTIDGLWNQTWCPGMTLRQWYAGQALALGAQFFHDYTGHGGIDDIVTVAYEIADAMIAKGAKPPEEERS